MKIVVQSFTKHFLKKKSYIKHSRNIEEYRNTGSTMRHETDRITSYQKSAVYLVDAVTCGCVGVNFFNKHLFVLLIPVLRLRLNTASLHRSPKKSASAIKTASASALTSTKRTTTIFIEADADTDADAQNCGNQTNMTKVEKITANYLDYLFGSTSSTYFNIFEGHSN